MHIGMTYDKKFTPLHVVVGSLCSPIILGGHVPPVPQWFRRLLSSGEAARYSSAILAPQAKVLVTDSVLLADLLIVLVFVVTRYVYSMSVSQSCLCSFYVIPIILLHLFPKFLIYV